jgi:hypothetical protein
MTATGGWPALSRAEAAAAAGAGDRSPVTTRSGAPQLRTVLALARVETSLLARSLLVLAGLLAGGGVVWLTIRSSEPLWWNIGWRIGLGQLVLGMAVLVATQLAVGRARRNAMSDLYASFPATAGIRTVAHLAGLLGAVPASLLLIGATAVVVQLEGAIGAPSIAVLAGGLLLVLAAGAVGAAIGARFAHPLAGVLGALALFLSSANSGLPFAAGLWLYPWPSYSDQLSGLPGPLAGYPPGGAHALELAGLAVLAGVVAIAVTVSRSRARGGLAAAGIIATAVICLAGALQLRPIPTADLNRLVSAVANPVSAERCTTANQVRYCLYPSFGSLLPSLEAPVNGVLAHVPARPSHPLTVAQAAWLSLPDSTITHGHSEQQVSQWEAQLKHAPGNASFAPLSPIYLSVPNWPAAGARLADAHFDLALAAADWAVDDSATRRPPANQARDAIAIWLAILATHPTAAELQTYPGSYLSSIGPQTSPAGYLLASAMSRLPEQKVSHVLTDAWARWTNPHTTDAQLAAALGIPMPASPRSGNRGPQ